MNDHEEGVLARSLLNGQGYTLEGKLSAHKPVLYTLILAACYYPFPEEWKTIPFDPSIHKKGVLVDQVLKIIVSGATVPLIYALGSALFSPVVGLFGGLLFAVNPQLMIQSVFPSRMAYDMLVFTWLLLSVLKLSRKAAWQNAPQRISAAVSFGFACGVSLLLNPSIFLFVCFSFLWLFFPTPYSGQQRVHRETALFSAAIIVILLAPWAYRNDRAFHQFIPFTDNYSLELWYGNNAHATGGLYRGPSFLAGQPALADMGEVERNQVLGQEAVQFILQHPATALKLRLLSAGYFWFGTWQFGGFPGFVSTLWFLLNAILVVLAWAGLVLALKRSWKNVLPVLAMLIGLSLPYVLSHGGDDRYRAGLNPIFMLLIAYLLIEIIFPALHVTKSKGSPIHVI